MSELSRFLRALIRSVRRSSARRTAPSISVGAGSSDGQVDRAQFLLPRRILGAADDIALECELRRLQCGFCNRQRLATIGRFGFRLHDVERREGAHFDTRAVVLNELVGELQRALRDIDGTAREDEIPIRVSNVRQRLGHGGTQRFLGDFTVDLSHRDLLPCLVDAEATQQRLRVTGRQADV